jgi:hypothetical protein
VVYHQIDVDVLALHLFAFEVLVILEVLPQFHGCHQHAVVLFDRRCLKLMPKRYFGELLALVKVIDFKLLNTDGEVESLLVTRCIYICLELVKLETYS